MDTIESKRKFKDIDDSEERNKKPNLRRKRLGPIKERKEIKAYQMIQNKEN